MIWGWSVASVFRGAVRTEGRHLSRLPGQGLLDNSDASMDIAIREAREAPPERSEAWVSYHIHVGILRKSSWTCWCKRSEFV